MLSTVVKWIQLNESVAIRKEIVEVAADIGETERPTSNVFAYAVKRLQDDLESGRLNDVPKS